MFDWNDHFVILSMCVRSEDVFPLFHFIFLFQSLKFLSLFHFLIYFLILTSFICFYLVFSLTRLLFFGVQETNFQFSLNVFALVLVLIFYAHFRFAKSKLFIRRFLTNANYLYLKVDYCAHL